MSGSSFVVRAAVCVSAAWLALGIGGCRHSGSSPSAGLGGTETIVVIRRGEKPVGGLGPLSCKGLNRALALPKVLIGRFGRADAIFAPDPAVQVREHSLTTAGYSYVRPLATIEPTAVALGLPVNAQIGFPDIARLQAAVTAPQYANSTIFVAWEHKYAYDFARQMLHTYRLDRAQVPFWPQDDFETVYVFRIRNGAMAFSVEKEGLSSSLSDTCPALP